MKRTLFILAMFSMIICSCYFLPEPIELPSEGLIAYYPFDGNLYDYSSSLNHCSDTTDGIFVDGISRMAKDFNGETDMLKLKYPLSVENGLTVSFWVKSKGVKEGQENGVVICKYDHTTWGRCFMINTQASWTVNNPSLRANFYAYGNTSNYLDGVYSNIMTMEDVPTSQDSSLFTLHEPMALPLNVWTHCVINTSDSEIEVWINGILTVSKIREYESYNDISQYFLTDVPSYIGNCPTAGSGNNNHFHGAIDEMRIYDRPLTEEEITLIYEHTKKNQNQNSEIEISS